MESGLMSEILVACAVAVLAALCKASVSWALSLREAVRLMADAIENSPDAKDSVRLMADNGASELARQVIKTAAADADPKPERKPANPVKRFLGHIVGNLVLRKLGG